MTGDRPPSDDPPRPPSARKKSELRRLARTHSEQAFQALVEVMNKPTAADHARTFAANIILEWGHGRRGATMAAAKKGRGRKTKTYRYILEPPSDP